MKLQKLLTSIIAAAVLICSCEKAPVEGTQLSGNIKNDLTFKLEISELTYNSVQIRVQHDGTTDDTWYGFLTSDLKKKDAALIAEKIEEITSGGEIKGLEKRTTKRIEFNDLEAAKTYRYIVFAITPDGHFYGNMAAINITMSVNPYVFTKTDEWKITRLDERMDNMEIISIESTSSSLYVWDYVSKAWVDNFNEAYPDGLDVQTTEDGPVLATVDAFQCYIINRIATIQYYVSQGDKITDYTYTYDSTDPNNNIFQMPRLSSGQYYFLAFGFNKDASHTQTYSISELVTIEEEEATSEYEAWLGNYTASGKGYWFLDDNDELGVKKGEERDITYNISIEHLDNNFMYLIKGWECGESALIDIETEFFELDKDKGDYIGFFGFYNNGKLELRETNITQVDGENAFAMCGYAHNGTTYAPVILENQAMAEAEPIPNGETSTTLKGLDLIYGNLTLKYDMMGYVYYKYQTLTPLAIPNMPVKFPITIEKTSPTESIPQHTNSRMKQEILRNMYNTPVDIEGNKHHKPVTYSRLQRVF